MRQKLYHLLVNRAPGIAYRYHKVHDGTTGFATVLSWLYLLLLNLGYHVLRLRFLGRRPNAETYESRRLPVTQSESALSAAKHPERTVERLVETLSQYEVVSFDVFDTLIFRPFGAPTDLFYFLDEPMGMLDFHRIRMEMESDARLDRFKLDETYEVTLREIWQRIERETGAEAARGMALEQQLELRFCYANPVMLAVYQALRERGVRIVITTDMYLPASFLRQLLEHCGYTGFERIYVSCEYRKSKGNGKLFEVLRRDLGEETRIVHIGDNPHSDGKMAEKHGLRAVRYPNVNQYSQTYRAHDLSALVGGAYRGIVNNHLYSGAGVYSMEYEYGFVYGGLFVVGYCAFIHDYCKRCGVDHILFLSRDGDTLKQVYDRLYPGERTSYVLWGRLPATKLMADYNRYDFFRRFLWHKSGAGKTAARILSEAGLDALEEALRQDGGKLRPDTVITPQNARKLKDWLLERWDEVLSCYADERTATQAYFADLLSGSRNVVAVDIGWAGSGAVSLSYLAERVWKLPCQVCGLIAGTNTVHNAEPDASEPMLQNGRLTSYLYSQRENRDLLKLHDLNRDYNVYWELLLSSPTRQFLGYALDEQGGVTRKFGDYDENQPGIREIQRGILDFAASYQAHFSACPELFYISGRDAYAPMVVAASHRERYLKAINRRFRLDISVGDQKPTRGSVPGDERSSGKTDV